MPKDVNELVLDAFRVEHREQLEKIRTLLGSLQLGGNVADDERLRDAFRLAHSFKGGARLCGLRGAEQLGHGLESILEHLNQGKLPCAKEVMSTVSVVLDQIEDWMAALEQQLPLPDIELALDAMQRVMASGAEDGVEIRTPQSKSSSLGEVFRVECEQHRGRLRRLLADCMETDDPQADESLREAIRVAHTLAGAAVVVREQSIESQARSIEQCLQDVLAGDQQLDAATMRHLEESLEAIQGGEYAAVDVSDGSAGEESPTAAPAHDTVRVDIDSLDRLLRSSGALWAENQRVAGLSHQLAALQTDFNDLEREREIMRRAALPNLHKLAKTPEFDRVLRYIEFVDSRLSSLAKRTRQASKHGHRVCWQVRARTAQVQRDVQESRLVPAHSIFQGFRKMVRDLAKSQAKQVEYQVDGLEVRADRMILQELKDPIMHVLRNCVCHGIELPGERRETGKPDSGNVKLSLQLAGGRLQVVVEDDGRGIDVRHVQQHAIRRNLLDETTAAKQSDEEALSLIFEPGFSTEQSVTELSGRGMGLSIVHDAVAGLQGEVHVTLRDTGGVRVILSVPNYVSTHRVLLVSCSGQTIAIPTQGIERLLRLASARMETMEGHPVVMYERSPTRLLELSELLGQETPGEGPGRPAMVSVILLKSGAKRLAVRVDELLEERDVMIHNLDELAASRQFAGGMLLDDGTPALVVQPSVLIESAQRNRTYRPAPHSNHDAPSEAKKVLIVDDSFTTRTLEKSILESQGFDVSVAVDGAEALTVMRQQKFALVISDIEMPRLDGFGLLEAMKADSRLAKTPVILVTSRDRTEDQRHGLELGADAYIVKRKFDHHELLNTIRQLL